jgi:hypothetical protein
MYKEATMKKQSMRAAMVFGISLVSLAVLAQGAFATAPFPSTGRSFSTYLVRAYDECTVPYLSVVSNPSDPPAGCPTLNLVTDEVPPTDPLGASMKWARLTVTKYPANVGGAGRIQLVGVGFQNGQRLSVQLTLRTSHLEAKVKHLPGPGSNKFLTFEDATVECGPGPLTGPLCGGSKVFTARPNGLVAGSVHLDTCLTQNGMPPGLAKGNIEILDAALVNCDTNKVVAKPGILNQ